MQNEPPLVSIVIVSYNVKSLLSDCIISLQKYISVPFEIIVVDNASADGTQESIKKDFPTVKLIENKSNIGFSAANNLGFNLAKAETIFILNPDTELKDNSFTILLDFIKNENDFIAGPELLNTDGTHQISYWHYPKVLQHVLELFFLTKFIDISKYKTINNKINTEVDFCSGAALLMKKTTLQKLNGLDEHLFWMDDVDLCYRNKLNGGKTFYVPGCNITHHLGASGKKNYNIVISNQIISKLKYYDKHKQYFNFCISLPVFLLQIATRIPIFLILSPVKKEFFKKFIAYCYTFVKLIKYLFMNEESVV